MLLGLVWELDGDVVRVWRPAEVSRTPVRLNVASRPQMADVGSCHSMPTPLQLQMYNLGITPKSSDQTRSDDRPALRPGNLLRLPWPRHDALSGVALTGDCLHGKRL